MGFERERYIFMIHPLFVGTDGSSYPIHEPVPQTVRAYMFVISEHVRPWLREIVHVGREVRMVEGNRTVAKGTVTRIENLFHDFRDGIEIAVAFLKPARAYVDWYRQTSRQVVQGANMRRLHELLAALQSAAAFLPAVAPTSAELPETSNRGLGKTLAEMVYSTLPFESYQAVFDPLGMEKEEPVECSLRNDLEEIYDDLQDGIALYRNGHSQDALWQWHFSYYAHWGRHLSHAQSAIWRYLAHGNW